MITVYGQQGCSPCVATKRVLDELGVDYTYVDVRVDNLTSTDVDLINTYGRTPIVATDTEHWSGFDADRLKNLA